MQQLLWPFFIDDEIKKILKYDELAAFEPFSPSRSGWQRHFEKFKSDLKRYDINTYCHTV